MEVTISQAAKMAGVSRATIYNDIEAGTLSVVQGAKDRKMVNVSELERVYKTLKSPEPEAESKAVEISQERHKVVDAGGQVAVLQERLEAQKKQTQFLEAQLTKEQEERVREREAAKTFEEYFKSQIENQAESIKNITRLLEDQRVNKESKPESNDWEKAFKALEDRISNQDTQAKKEIEELRKNSQQQVMRYKTALEAEKTKPFWKKLFA